jgi:hypothetical protein
MLEYFLFIEHPILDMCSTETRLPFFITYKPNYRPCSAAGTRSACQEISCFLFRRKVHYRVQNTLPLLHILSQMKPVHTVILYLLNLISMHQHLGFLSDIFLQGRETAAITIKYNKQRIPQYPKSVQKWRTVHTTFTWSKVISMKSLLDTRTVNYNTIICSWPSI